MEERDTGLKLGVGDEPDYVADYDYVALSVRMADRYVWDHDGTDLDATVHRIWHYENACVLKGIEQVWQETGDPSYFNYIQDRVNRFVLPSGDIQTYSLSDYNLDQICEGKLLFSLFRETGEERYRMAIERLLTQLKSQPRTKNGGFWHKKIYPFQMWLDGVYMAAPFLAEYAKTFQQPEWFDVVARQILTLEEKCRDTRTGLLYHAWDESREQRWANPETGCSPHFWGRAMGWFTMAMVDVLDFLPVDHPERGQIVGVFHRMMKSLLAVQDPVTGLWYQVLDRPNDMGNYLESSCSAMFVYSLAKGIRHGYLEKSFAKSTMEAHRGLICHRVKLDDNGIPHLTHCNAVAGLGNTPYRDGSYEYYVSEPVIVDDPKALGPFMLAGLEMKRLARWLEGELIMPK